MRFLFFDFQQLRRGAAKLGWGLRVVGPLAAVQGFWRLARVWLIRPTQAEVKLRSGPVLEFDYPGQFPPALLAFGDFIDPEFDFLRDVVAPDGMILDVGAAIGQFSMFAAICLPDATVHAFEPSSANVKTLNRNIVRNGVEKRVIVHQAALSNREETARFATTPKAWMSQLAAADSLDPHSELVGVHTLTATLKSLRLDHVDVLKINVAGFEPAVLEGAMPCLAAGQVDILIVLLGLRSLALYETIAGLDYRFFYYHPPKRTLFEVTSFDETAVLDHRPWPARHIIAIRSGALKSVVGGKVAVRPLVEPEFDREVRLPAAAG
ncbi:MAG: FkbM family methyltransferase [Devosia sp.]